VTDAYRVGARESAGVLVSWGALAAFAGLTSVFGFDVRLALAVVIVARVSFGRRAGAVAVSAGAVVTLVAAAIAQSSDFDVATGTVAAVALVLEAVVLSHLVSYLADKVGSRERPVRRFLVLSSSMVVGSLVFALAESIVAEIVVDSPTASFPERGAAIVVGCLAGSSVASLVRGRWFRYQGSTVDELTAPFAALVVVVLALQITGELWRISDRDNLREAGVDVAAGLVAVVSDDVNALDARLAESADDQLDATGLVSVALVARLADGASEVLFDDADLATVLDDPRLVDAPEGGDGLIGDTTVTVDGRQYLAFALGSSSARYVALLSVDDVIAAARGSLAGLYRDVDFDLVTNVDPEASATRVEVPAVIDDAVFVVSASATDSFGVSGNERLVVIGVEGLLGVGVIAVLLLGAASQVRVGIERRRRESLLEAALDATPGLSVVFDGAGKVLAANAGVRETCGDRIPGIAVTEALGFGAETVRARIVSELMETALAGEHGHGEVTGDGDDEMRILELETYPVRAAGDDRVGLLHVTDATERRNVAMRTAQAERMESLGALAGGLAHDFNNLLFVTLGNLQLMAMNETISGDEKLSKFLSRSMSAVERGAEITKSLLAVARSQPLEETAVSLADLVKGLLPLVKQALGAGRTVEVEIPDPSLQLLVDAGRLQSCILNLAFNSRDAMGPNGTVRIAARRRDDVIDLSVSDDGAGMSADVVARAFEPFFTTKKAGSGTGLGLATVYAFAQQSGGTATLESRVGVGTTVTLVLPLHRPGSTTTPVPSSRRSGRRVVVADDEQALAEMVAAWLIDVGVDARFALSPRSALELIAEFPPDVLVSDANFGEEQDGLDLARLATAGLPDLAVIFMTGYSSSMKQLQELGERTLAKPFSRDDLYAAVLPLLADDVLDRAGDDDGSGAGVDAGDDARGGGTHG